MLTNFVKVLKPHDWVTQQMLTFYRLAGKSTDRKVNNSVSRHSGYEAETENTSPFLKMVRNWGGKGGVLLFDRSRKSRSDTQHGAKGLCLVVEPE